MEKLFPLKQKKNVEIYFVCSWLDVFCFQFACVCGEEIYFVCSWLDVFHCFQFVCVWGREGAGELCSL